MNTVSTPVNPTLSTTENLKIYVPAIMPVKVVVAELGLFITGIFGPETRLLSKKQYFHFQLYQSHSL